MFESAKGGREKRDIRSVAKFIELALVLDKDMVSTLELVISAALFRRLPRLLFISSSLPSSVRQAARFLAKGRHSRRHSGGQHRRSGKSPSISISNAIGWLAQKRRIKKLCMLVEVDRESRLSAANSCQVGFPTNGKRIYEIEGDLALLPSLSSHLRPPAIDHSTLHLFSPV